VSRIHKAAGENGVEVAAGAASLPFPPVDKAGIDFWESAKLGAIPLFDIEYTSDSTSSLTGAELNAGVPEPQVIADDDIDVVNFAANELDVAGHSYEDGDGPVRLTTTGTLPAGLEADKDYWIHVVNAGTIQLAESRDNALNGEFVSFTDAGSGTHTIVDTPDTERLHWLSHGLLGQRGDGAISLEADKGFVQRVAHRPRASAYAVSSTVSAGLITIEIYPVLATGN